MRTLYFKRPKVFCVGANKTGTTSVGAFLTQAGYKLAPQIPAERLIEKWAIRDFAKIGAFCRRFEAFQDVPFSLDFTFQYLDQIFPNSKFILTIRSSADEWLESYKRFTKKILGGDKSITRENLEKIDYNYRGFFLRSLDLIYGECTDPFQDDVYKQNYLYHNYSIQCYFQNRTDKLLTINLADKDSSRKLCSFLDIKYDQNIPHLNISQS